MAESTTGTTTTDHTGTDTTKHTGTDTEETEETGDMAKTAATEQEMENTVAKTGSATKNTEASGETDGTAAENISGTDEYIDHIYGKTGSASYSALLTEYRETLINIDMMVINELEVCFMNIY